MSHSLEGPTAPVEAPARLTVAGHDVTLFVETGPLIAAMADDIRAARDRVWLETYIFLDDHAGQVVADALKERAVAGADVRVLYDAIGSQTTPQTFVTAHSAASREGAGRPLRCATSASYR